MTKLVYRLMPKASSAAQGITNPGVFRDPGQTHLEKACFWICFGGPGLARKPKRTPRDVPGAQKETPMDLKGEHPTVSPGSDHPGDMLNVQLGPPFVHSQGHSEIIACMKRLGMVLEQLTIGFALAFGKDIGLF